MKKPFLLVTVLSTIFLFLPCTYTTNINPQLGDSEWTLISRFGQVSDGTIPTLIYNADQVGGVISLSSVGNYQVAENLTYPIVISADKICLDLNCYDISHNNSNQNVITINPGKKEIKIYNGYIHNTGGGGGSGSGILISNGASRVYVEKLKIFGCGNGIKLDGQDGNEIIECEFIALDLVSNTTGLVLNHADENIIKDCTAFHNTQAGFELLNSEANCFYDCQALKTYGNQSTMGFTTRAGQSNLFQRCVAKKTKTSAWEFCNKAYGFLLTSTEEKTKLIECIVNETDVTSTVSAVPYGICLEPILLEGSDLLASLTNDTRGNQVISVAWSPDRKYIASGEAGGYVRVFSFDGINLTHIDSDHTAGANDIRSVAWSPDGKYIVSGDDGGYVRVFSFDGSNLTYIDGDNTPVVQVWPVAWSPDGKFIVSGDDGGSVRVFSFDGTNLTPIIDNTPGNQILSVAWSPNGKYIVIGDVVNHIRVFSFDGANLICIADNAIASLVSSVAWSPDGKYIVSGDSGNHIQVFSFNVSNLVYIDEGNTGGLVWSVAWSPDGKCIVSGDTGNYVQVFGFDGTSLTHINDVDAGDDVHSVAWSSDGNYIVSGDSGNYVRVFDAMYGPQNCLIDNCKVRDTLAYGQFVGTGIAGGGTSHFANNMCCNNEVNYTFGIPNVYYGRHNIERNTVAPFDNVSMPTTP